MGGHEADRGRRAAAGMAAALAVCLLSGGAALVQGGEHPLLQTVSFLAAGAGAWITLRQARASRSLAETLQTRSAAAERMCVAAVEALAYAVEARTGCCPGHMKRVQAYSLATGRALGVDGETLSGLRVAALAHEVGRLGVPDRILGKQDALTDEERETVRAYPVLGGGLLASIPFPWPVVPFVRHHLEHYDGSGYPDRLAADAIPLGARILAVADTYDTLMMGSGSRPTRSHAEAMAAVESVAGTQFDPAVVRAFRAVADDVSAHLTREQAAPATGNAAREIAQAQREVQALYRLARSFGATLCLADTLEAVARHARAIAPADACVIFLRDEDGDLRARAAYGVNHWHFRRSRARLGTYLTGRAAWRGEPVLAAYMPADLHLGRAAEPWTPLRSTLVVPLRAGGAVIGTLNLYHTQPEAFTRDDLRVMDFIGELAGQALHNARLFTETQETACTDAVTGLRNRRYCRKQLEQEVTRALRNGRPLALLGLDLDGFKRVNDTCGHDRGDEILRELGQVFQAHARNYDLVARWAGDEFVILLPETDRAQAQVVASRIRDAVDHYATARRERDPDFPGIGVSIGMAVCPEDAQDGQALLALADRRMYGNKRARLSAQNAA